MAVEPDSAGVRFPRRLVYLGAPFWGWRRSGSSPLLPLVLIAMQMQVIVREERYLEAKFGDDYRRYKAEVRRWL